MVTQARVGAVVAFWSGADLDFGIVAGEEKQRVRLVGRRGQDERVTPARIVLEVAPPEPARGGDERRAATERTAAIDQRVRARAADIDVRLLWEIVVDGCPPDGEGLPVGATELAELACGGTSGEQQAAVLLALLADGLHFVRRGESWIARPGQAVDDLRHARERIREREAGKRAFIETARAALQHEQPATAASSDVERAYRDALLAVAVHDEAAPDTARSLALEALAAVGLRYERPHEGAFRLLRRLGAFRTDDENLQVLRFQLRTAFPAAVLELARGALERGFDPAGRRDLTSLTLVSIDGPTTREIDDALSLETGADGLWQLGVHIADPAAFVLPGDALDGEALARCLTYYMPDMRLPMLPPAISEQAASLIPGATRPALSFLIRLDATARVVDYEICRAVVRSSAGLDYEAADRAIAAGSGPHAPLLRQLADLAARRLALRVAAGALVILQPEVDLHVDPEGRIVVERLPADSPSRAAVAEAMVLAGEVAARHCQAQRLPVIYRRQSLSGSPGEGSSVARDPIAARKLLRWLKRAEPGLEPGPHVSLGLPAYVQVTSPIRRYQDLVTHRQIAADLAGLPLPHGREDVQRILATTEQAELDARRAERAADEYWMLRLLEGQVGQVVEALVVETVPRPVVQLLATLKDQVVPGLTGAEVGQVVRVRVERVNARAGILVLRPA